MDPTLLLMKNDWDEVSVEPKYSGYIFVYQLSPSKYMTNAYAFNSLGRKSCYDCKYKGDNRVADITIRFAKIYSEPWI